jgi:hypothetical protein
VKALHEHQQQRTCWRSHSLLCFALDSLASRLLVNFSSLLNSLIAHLLAFLLSLVGDANTVATRRRSPHGSLVACGFASPLGSRCSLLMCEIKLLYLIVSSLTSSCIQAVFSMSPSVRYAYQANGRRLAGAQGGESFNFGPLHTSANNVPIRPKLTWTFM